MAWTGRRRSVSGRHKFSGNDSTMSVALILRRRLVRPRYKGVRPENNNQDRIAMLQGEAKRAYQREYMRKKRAGEVTCKPKTIADRQEDCPVADQVSQSNECDLEAGRPAEADGEGRAAGHSSPTGHDDRRGRAGACSAAKITLTAEYEAAKDIGINAKDVPRKFMVYPDYRAAFASGLFGSREPENLFRCSSICAAAPALPRRPRSAPVHGRRRGIIAFAAK